jgi:hypothetical protein
LNFRLPRGTTKDTEEESDNRHNVQMFVARPLEG